MPLLSELHRIAEYVVQDLLEPPAVTYHIPTFEDGQIAGIPDHLKPFADAYNVDHVHGFFQNVC